MGNEEKVLFMMSHLQEKVHKFIILNYNLYLQNKRLVPWFGVYEAFIKKLKEMYSNVNIVVIAK